MTKTLFYLNAQASCVKGRILRAASVVMSSLLSVSLMACMPVLTFKLSDPNSPQVAYSGPLVISKGGTYSGNWQSLDPSVPAVSVQTSEPVILENSVIRGQGTLIRGFGSRLTVRNVNGYGLNPRVAGRGIGAFLAVENFINVRIENVLAENTRGLYFKNYKGDASSGDTITVVNNQFRNINGLLSDGHQAYDLNTKGDGAHFLLFNDVKRIPNVEIAWNEVINEPGKSLVEENINMHGSGGMPDSHIKIHDNYIQGAYAPRPAKDTPYAGGGIIVGDGAGNDPQATGYVDVYNNQVVSTTNQGIAIAGGAAQYVYNNRVVSSGMLPDGAPIVAQNVGIYMWNFDSSTAALKANFKNNRLENNYVAWTKVHSDGSRSTNPWWLPSCEGSNTCAGNTSGGEVTFDAERQEYQQWIAKLAAAGKKIGRQP